MQLLLKYTIELRKLPKCDHERDCGSLRANSRECTTCYRCEWRMHELSRAAGFIELLPTSGFVQDLLFPHEKSRRWWQLNKDGRRTLQVCI